MSYLPGTLYYEASLRLRILLNRYLRRVIIYLSPARVSMTTVLADCGTFGVTETDMAALK